MVKKIPNQIRKILSKSRYSYKYIIIKKPVNPDISKPFYFDIDIFTILKFLYKNHKINKYDFKNSIKKIIHNKTLSNKVYSGIHYFLSSIKAHTGKNTITGLKRTESRTKRFISVKKSIHSYAVYIKLKYYKMFMNNTLLINDYENIQKEFIKFMSNQNNKYFKSINNIDNDNQYIKNIGGVTKTKLFIK